MDEELQRLARKANEASASADIDIEVERLFRARERANLCRVCGVPEPGDIGICVPCRERVFKALLHRRNMYEAIFESRPGTVFGRNANVNQPEREVAVGHDAPRPVTYPNTITWGVVDSCRPCNGVGYILGRRCNECLGGGTARL